MNVRPSIIRFPAIHRFQVIDTTAFCMKWANIQLKYFCGYRSTCKELPDGGAEAYQIALHNMLRNFLLVVVVEKVRGATGLRGLCPLPPLP